MREEIIHEMWRRLLQCKTDAAVIRDESLIPVLHRRISTTVNLLFNGSLQRSSTVKVSSEEDAQKEQNDDKKYSSESPKQLLENSSVNTDTVPPGPDDIWSDGPYPTKSNYRQSQAKFSVRPNIDPKETSIILFPGQGTQYVGMGKEMLEYPNVRSIYEAASQILGYDLLRLSLEGPADKLSKTEYQQPAVVVASLAAVEKLREERPHVLESCIGVAGYSVGEITALTFAGSLSFEDAIKLVKVRAEAMQYASEIVPSGMMTVLYGPDSRLEFACSVAKEFCQRKGIPEVDCRIASYLYPHCKVIAGNDEALSFIQDNKDDFRLKRLKRLPVSGAFHTNLMKPAAILVRKALDKMQIDPPIIPVHSNIDGKKYKNVKEIITKLPKQIYTPVKWEQTMHIIYERSKGVDFPRTYECGPKKSLKTILRMINAKASDACKCIEA
ncbi:probable malonyl-CoA-acyl carrier protein transacylase, mitochondrial isoform X1 [Macrobrachium nipponense]|uniref:probable malonyl-CoA-acyl carrier protein transacylase, mitochondrial isoform X1 n=2 Tax=Macrobrachium nipponense TaxID=159736 RepID=UPI0030C85A82